MCYTSAMPTRSRDDLIRRRLQPFCEAGLLSAEEIPTWWQLRQAEIEMTPYVISTDATAESGYDGRLLGHPILRQPLIVSQVGLDHFRTGSGLGARHGSVCKHLHLTFHQGMPVFDLQVVQTHPDGLARLRERTLAVIHGTTAEGRRIGRLGRLTLSDPQAYYDQFLGDDGWIARAERFDYPGPASEGSVFPREFFSLVDLARYAAQAFSPALADTGWRRLPLHLARLGTRRFREGKRFGWFARDGGQ